MWDWWPLAGDASAMALSALTGALLGLAWAMVSTSRRRRLFIDAAVPPVGQAAWFLANLVAMGSYLTLVTLLGLLGAEGAISPQTFWMLLAAASLAFCAALMFAHVPQRILPEPARREAPAATVAPLRRLA